MRRVPVRLTSDNVSPGGCNGVQSSIESFQFVDEREILRTFPDVDAIGGAAIQQVLTQQFMGGEDYSDLTTNKRQSTFFLSYTRARTQDCEMDSILCISLSVTASHICGSRSIMHCRLQQLI